MSDGYDILTVRPMEICVGDEGRWRGQLMYTMIISSPELVPRPGRCSVVVEIEDSDGTKSKTYFDENTKVTVWRPRVRIQICPHCGKRLDE